ncbi:MAG: DUF1294 domain-containing protein [Patescibacteria group bacterium]
MNPDFLRSFILWILLVIGGYFGVTYFFILPFLLSFFLALNIATLTLMALDKLFASLHVRRTPENVFYLATFLGGSIGMLLGMFLFRHKTRKTSFQFVVGFLVLAQIGLLTYLYSLK